MAIRSTGRWTDGTATVIRCDSETPFSSASVRSRPIPLEGGNSYAWAAVYRIVQAPAITPETMPVPEFINKLGDAEARSPGIIWGVVFLDEDDKPMEGPGYWELNRQPSEWPLTAGGWFRTPARAASFQIKVTFIAKGTLVLHLGDIVLRRVPAAERAPLCSVYETGRH